MLIYGPSIFINVSRFFSAQAREKRKGKERNFLFVEEIGLLPNLSSKLGLKECCMENFISIIT